MNKTTKIIGIVAALLLISVGITPALATTESLLSGEKAVETESECPCCGDNINTLEDEIPDNICGFFTIGYNAMKAGVGLQRTPNSESQVAFQDSQSYDQIPGTGFSGLISASGSFPDGGDIQGGSFDGTDFQSGGSNQDLGGVPPSFWMYPWWNDEYAIQADDIMALCAYDPWDVSYPALFCFGIEMVLFGISIEVAGLIVFNLAFGVGLGMILAGLGIVGLLAQSLYNFYQACIDIFGG